MAKSKSTPLSLLLVLAILCISLGHAAPQNNRGGNNNGASRGGGNRGGGKQTAQQKAAQKPGGVSTAADGSTMLDKTVQIK